MAEQGGSLFGFSSGLGVWTPARLARCVRTFGGHRRQGDRVRIAGVFNAACRERGGDTDTHAISVKALASGRTIPHERHRGKIAAVLAFGVLVVAPTAAERGGAPARGSVSTRDGRQAGEALPGHPVWFTLLRRAGVVQW